MLKPCKHPPKKRADETDTQYQHGVVIAHRERQRCEACGVELSPEVTHA